MSTGIWHRLEQAFEAVIHHHDATVRKNAIMSALDRLKNGFTIVAAENADLKKQLAAAQAAPPTIVGTSDADLNAAIDAFAAEMGITIPDPDAPASGGTSATPVSVVVAAPTVLGTTTVSVAPDPSAPASAPSTPATGSTVSGPGIASGTTVADGSTASTIVLSDPTTEAHAGDGTETLTVTPPAATVGSTS